MRYLAEHPRQGRDDEIWMLSHKPVFTQGQAGRSEHILDAGDIPIVHIDSWIRERAHYDGLAIF